MECPISTTQHEFPVVDGSSRLRGVLTRDEIIKALKQRGPETSVLEVMRADIPTVDNRGALNEDLRAMQEKQLPAVGVADGAGRLIGLVTPENVGEMMMIQAARPELRPGAGWRAKAPGPSG